MFADCVLCLLSLACCAATVAAAELGRDDRRAAP